MSRPFHSKLQGESQQVGYLEDSKRKKYVSAQSFRRISGALRDATYSLYTNPSDDSPIVALEANGKSADRSSAGILIAR